MEKDKVETPAEEQKAEQLETGEEKPKAEELEKEEDFVCTPYTFSNTSGKEVDYDKLIKNFGTRPISKDLLEEFERVTGEKAHIYLRRGSSS